LIDKLNGDADMGWNTYNRGKPMTPRQLAKLLDPYGIKPKTVRQKDGTTPKGYERADFWDAFERYIKPDPARQPATATLKPAPPGEVAATAQHEWNAPDSPATGAERFGVADTPQVSTDTPDDAPF
jgi:putative DNA primase/helicase